MVRQRCLSLSLLIASSGLWCSKIVALAVVLSKILAWIRTRYKSVVLCVDPIAFLSVQYFSCVAVLILVCVISVRALSQLVRIPALASSLTLQVQLFEPL